MGAVFLIVPSFSFVNRDKDDAEVYTESVSLPGSVSLTPSPSDKEQEQEVTIPVTPFSFTPNSPPAISSFQPSSSPIAMPEGSGTPQNNPWHQSQPPTMDNPTAEPNKELPTIPATIGPALSLSSSVTPASLTATPSTLPTFVPSTAYVHEVVSRLSWQTFKENIETLSNFGDRVQGSTSYNNAANWVKLQLQDYGYTVQEHTYTYRGSPRTNIFVTKVGSSQPDQMYIVSAHLDGRGGGGAANDNGSGCSLVLELARVLMARSVQLDVSVRFIFWNNEETGLNGAHSYVADRLPLQGIAVPSGSNVYPEPTWLGVITHDQILFDHGLPVGPNQSPEADADIEYQANSVFAPQSRALAIALKSGNNQFATDYPSQVSSDMCCTDSVPFQDLAPSVSIRENRRRAEIGNGSQPHWHQPTDLYTTFDELDFLFGFNIVQTTTGTICQLARLHGI
jgi:hypothetical protein